MIRACRFVISDVLIYGEYYKFTKKCICIDIIIKLHMKFGTWSDIDSITMSSVSEVKDSILLCNYKGNVTLKVWNVDCTVNFS